MKEEFLTKEQIRNRFKKLLKEEEKLVYNVEILKDNGLKITIDDYDDDKFNKFQNYIDRKGEGYKRTEFTSIAKTFVFTNS